MERRPPAPAPPRRTGAPRLEGGTLTAFSPLAATPVCAVYKERPALLAWLLVTRTDTKRNKPAAVIRLSGCLGMGSRLGLRSRCGGCTCPGQCRGTEWGGNGRTTMRSALPALLLASRGWNFCMWQGLGKGSEICPGRCSVCIQASRG